jgi:hypothetical protein
MAGSISSSFIGAKKLLIYNSQFQQFSQVISAKSDLFPC